MAEDNAIVKGFVKNKSSFEDGAVFDALESAFSTDRLGTYLAEANGNLEQALRLYAWNTALGAVFYGALQTLEITARNAMHRHLCDTYGENWYDNSAAGLNDESLKRINEAKERLGKKITPSNVVAKLTFGFWVALFSTGRVYDKNQQGGNYEMTLWRPALRKVFPNVDSLERSEVLKRFNHLRNLRNRIAHHEHILDHNLSDDYETILTLLGWICEPAKDWLDQHSRIREVLAINPEQGDIRF